MNASRTIVPRLLHLAQTLCRYEITNPSVKAKRMSSFKSFYFLSSLADIVVFDYNPTMHGKFTATSRSNLVVSFHLQNLIIPINGPTPRLGLLEWPAARLVRVRLAGREIRATALAGWPGRIISAHCSASVWLGCIPAVAVTDMPVVRLIVQQASRSR